MQSWHIILIIDFYIALQRWFILLCKHCLEAINDNFDQTVFYNVFSCTLWSIELYFEVFLRYWVEFGMVLLKLYKILLRASGLMPSDLN